MCPCDLSREYVCGYHTKLIKDLHAELRDLEPREQDLSVMQWDRLRRVRGVLRLEGLRAEMVIHQVKTREWDESNA